MKARFDAFLKASERGPVVVTRKRRPVAVLVSVQNEDEVERLLMACSPHLRAILDRSRKQFRDGQWLTEEDFWAQFEHAEAPKPQSKPRKKRV